MTGAKLTPFSFARKTEEEEEVVYGKTMRDVESVFAETKEKENSGSPKVIVISHPKPPFVTRRKKEKKKKKKKREQDIALMPVNIFQRNKKL
jgi:hypothetical protein